MVFLIDWTFEVFPSRWLQPPYLLQVPATMEMAPMKNGRRTLCRSAVARLDASCVPHPWGQNH